MTVIGSVLPGTTGLLPNTIGFNVLIFLVQYIKKHLFLLLKLFPLETHAKCDTSGSPDYINDSV